MFSALVIRNVLNGLLHILSETGRVKSLEVQLGGTCELSGLRHRAAPHGQCVQAFDQEILRG